MSEPNDPERLRVELKVKYQKKYEKKYLARITQLEEENGRLRRVIEEHDGEKRKKKRAEEQALYQRRIDKFREAQEKSEKPLDPLDFDLKKVPAPRQRAAQIAKIDVSFGQGVRKTWFFRQKHPAEFKKMLDSLEDGKKTLKVEPYGCVTRVDKNGKYTNYVIKVPTPLQGSFGQQIMAQHLPAIDKYPRDGEAPDEGAECSHLCKTATCFRADHVIIESRANNIKRKTSCIGSCQCGLEPKCIRM